MKTVRAVNRNSNGVTSVTLPAAWLAGYNSVHIAQDEKGRIILTPIEDPETTESTKIAITDVFNTENKSPPHKSITELLIKKE